MAEVNSVPLSLVLGPARSGKSRWAEHLASKSSRQVVYIATGPSPSEEDREWQKRIQIHRLRRPDSWHVQEVGFALPAAVDALSPRQCGLVDSLGSWVCGGLELAEDAWLQQCDQLIAAIGRCGADLLFVSEQTGWGVVPATAIGGLFRDRLGAIEQELMHHCDHAWLVVAGRALDLMATAIQVPRS